MREPKCLMQWVLIVLTILIAGHTAPAQSPAIKNSTLSAGGSSHDVMVGGTRYFLQQSIGQSSAIGPAGAGGLVLRQGFIQPHSAVSDKTASTLPVGIFPNPFSAQLTIVLMEPPAGKVHVIISDLQGRVALDQLFEGEPIIFVQPGALAAGQYLIRIYANEMQHLSKLIKE